MSRLRNTVKKWFLNFLKPPQEHFHFWMESIWFKDEKIPTNNIEGLSSLLNAKADTQTVNQQLLQKVDKVNGKGLSTNDYTTIEKTKLAGIEAGANKNVQSDWNATSGDAFIRNKPNIPSPITYVAGTNIDIDNANPSQPVISATVNNNSQVQSDWATSDINDVSFIKNKPNIPVLPASLSNITQTDIDNWNKTGLEVKTITTEDLNTVKQSNIYIQPKWTRATTARNYPRKQSGYLMVFARSNGMGYQTFVTEKSIVYFRKMSANGSFLQWQELKGSNYIFDDDVDTVFTPQQYFDNHRLIMKTELKTATSLGLTNETGYCTIKTFVSRDAGKAVQQAFCFDTGNVYKRYATSSTNWSAWELSGIKGDTGKSAYQIYVDNVPAGTTVLTAPQWLASLKGDKGDKGDTGTGGGGSTVSQLQTSASITTSQLIDTHSQNGKHVMLLNGANNLTITIDSTDKFCSTYQKTGAGNITFVAGTGKTLVQVDGTNIINGKVGSSATVSIVGTTIYLRIANA